MNRKHFLRITLIVATVFSTTACALPTASPLDSGARSSVENEAKVEEICPTPTATAEQEVVMNDAPQANDAEAIQNAANAPEAIDNNAPENQRSPAEREALLERVNRSPKMPLQEQKSDGPTPGSESVLGNEATGDVNKNDQLTQTPCP